MEVVEAEVGDGGDDDRTLAALRGRRRRGPDAGGRRLARGLVDRRRAAGVGDAGAGPAGRGDQHHRRRPVGGGDPARSRRARRRLLRGERPEVAAGARGDRRARRPPRDRAADVLPPVGGFFAASTPYAVGRDALWPDARRFETAGLHKPSIVGLARSAGWLSMFVGLPWAHERAARLAAGAAERLAAMPACPLAHAAGPAWRRSSRSGWPAGPASRSPRRSGAGCTRSSARSRGSTRSASASPSSPPTTSCGGSSTPSRRSRRTPRRRCPRGRRSSSWTWARVTRSARRSTRRAVRCPRRLPPTPATRLARGSLAAAPPGADAGRSGGRQQRRRRRRAGRPVPRLRPGARRRGGAARRRPPRPRRLPLRRRGRDPRFVAHLPRRAAAGPARASGAGGAPPSACSRRSRSRTSPSCVLFQVVKPLLAAVGG